MVYPDALLSSPTYFNPTANDMNWAVMVYMCVNYSLSLPLLPLLHPNHVL